MFRYIAFAAALAMATPTAAEPVDGKVLLAACERAVQVDLAAMSAQEFYDEGYCDGILGGFGNIALRDHVYCPKGPPLTTRDVRRVVYPYLLRHKHRLGDLAMSLTFEALAEAWPCPDTGPDRWTDEDRAQ